MSKKKLTKVEKESNLLAENVKVLRCGLYGYVWDNKVIFKSSNLQKVNDLSKWVALLHWAYENPESEIIEHAKDLQKWENSLFIPNQLPCTKGERIVCKGHHYESVIREKY